jgi:hypothetical protein
LYVTAALKVLGYKPPEPWQDHRKLRQGNGANRPGIDGYHHGSTNGNGAGHRLLSVADL